MKLFILYQTDKWKSKASPMFFRIFNCRNKAIDFAKYYNLVTPVSAVLIQEVGLNEFGEV